MTEAPDDGDGDADGDSDSGSWRPLVALDTSVLMAPVERDLRPIEELERVVPDATPVVPESVVAELERLSDAGAGEAATAASVGRDLADRLRTVADPEPGALDDAVSPDADAGNWGTADDVLVALAASGRVAYVATADHDLRDRVLSRDVPVICLRGERQLAITRL